MRVQLPHRLSLSAYLSTSLIIATGSCFAVLCMLILLVELTVKLIVVPVIFLFAMVCLVYGFLKRTIYQVNWGRIPAHS